MTVTERASKPAKAKPEPRLTRVKTTAASVAKAEHRLNLVKDKRDLAIIEAYEQGVGTRHIAVAAGLSNSGVRKIVGADTS